MPLEAFFNKVFYQPTSSQWKVAPKERIVMPSAALATSPATSSTNTAIKATADLGEDEDDDNYFQEREIWMVYGLGEDGMRFLVPS